MGHRKAAHSVGDNVVFMYERWEKGRKHDVQIVGVILKVARHQNHHYYDIKGTGTNELHCWIKDDRIIPLRKDYFASRLAMNI